ncbi:hypothetical protein ACFX1T_009136 [Malus domestica]
MHIQSIFRQILRVPSNPMRNQSTSQADLSNPKDEVSNFLEGDPKLDQTSSRTQPLSLAVHRSMQAFFSKQSRGHNKTNGIMNLKELSKT